MSKTKPHLTINLNLLKPQSNPEKLLAKILQWLLYAGRYIFVVVNALVLIAFIARFKLDADLAARNESIAEKIPFIESLKPYEFLIRNTQLKLSTMEITKKNSLDWPFLLKKIADQVPTSVTITSLNIENTTGKTDVHLAGQTQYNNDVTNFITGLKEDNTFSNVDLASINLEQGIVKFTINTSAKLTASGGQSL